MTLRKTVLLLACLLPLCAAAAPRITKPGVKSSTTFAIFVDSKSYAKASAEIDDYRAAVEQDGLGTYLLVDDWASPEAVKAEIAKMTKARPQLEGVVFVGDIPIPMIRNAQHLTSAFKTDKNRDWKKSSVPSDRFYDDQHLRFDFLKQDSDNPLYFYYSLSSESSQHIASNIYSARIKPPRREGVDSYELLKAYMKKVAAAHREVNTLDNLFVFRGHGYNSEAPEAWAGEQLSLREQLPNLFLPSSKIRFYDFESRWPIKPYLLEKMTQPDVDIALCHHHGGPEMQYMNGYRNGSDVNTSIQNIKLYLRSKLDGVENYEVRKADFMANLGVPAAWCEVTDSLRAADSVLNYMMDIYVEDIHQLAVNPRFVMFDACFNGSFHLDDCIASSYIFSPGATLLAQGNSVNALQDKWPDRYIGMLDCGVRFGQWGRHVNYLETHLIGDPTYRFANRSMAGTDLNAAITTRADDDKFWLGMLNASMPADVQAIALRKLRDNGYNGLLPLLEKQLRTSPYGGVRLEALRQMSNLQVPQFIDALQVASTDSYELVRRMAAGYLFDCGDNALIPTFVTMMTDDNLSQRVMFQLEEGLIFLDAEQLKSELQKQYAAKTYLYNGEQQLKRRISRIDNDEKGLAESFEFIHNTENTLKKRISEVTYFRRYRHHDRVPQLIAVAEDALLETELRTAAVEALGWFGRSYRRNEIKAMCDRFSAAQDLPAELVAEAHRTRNRLSAY